MDLPDGTVVIQRRQNGWVTAKVRRDKLVDEQVFQDEQDVMGHIRSLADMIRTLFSSELRTPRRGGLDLYVAQVPKK